MKKVAMLFAAMAVVFGFGQTAAAFEAFTVGHGTMAIATEQLKIFRGDEVINTLELGKIGHIDHIRKAVVSDGKEILLPVEATRVEFKSSRDNYWGVMYLNTTELVVKAGSDFFIHGYNKALTMDDVVGIQGNTIRPRWLNRVSENGNNERGLFVYGDSNDVFVTRGIGVEISVFTLRVKDGVRRVEVGKKTISF